MNRPGASSSSTGLPPHAAAALSYLAWWVSGLLFYLVEHENRFVRFHAAQALVGLGAIWALGLALWIAGFVIMFVSVALFKVFVYCAYGAWAAGIVVWAICIVRAWQGVELELPWAGPIARRLSQRDTHS